MLASIPVIIKAAVLALACFLNERYTNVAPVTEISVCFEIELQVEGG